MIDVENEIYIYVSEKLRKEFPDVFFPPEYVRAPSAFPCVFLQEVNNRVDISTQTSSETENHARVTYELSVYSNKKTGNREECKHIASIVDEAMSSLGFTRIMMSRLPNMAEATIYRITARYIATVDRNHTIYRR